MTESGKLNCSVNMLAKAMRRVFSEEVEKAIIPKRKDMTAVKGRLERRNNERLRRTNPQPTDAEGKSPLT